jgi:hypothetical protein
MKPQNTKMPDDWFVFEAGQSITDATWFVNIVNKTDLQNHISCPRQVKVENKESFDLALTEAVENINS